MNKKKMNSLMIGQSLVLGIIIIFFGLVIVKDKVPNLKIKNVEQEINSYYEEKYSDLEVTKSDLRYDKDKHSYSITYYDNDYKSLNFTITYLNNKVTDNYQDNFIKGKKIINKASKDVLKKYKEVFSSTNYENFKVKFKDLNKYNDKEIINILEGNIYDTGYYLVSCYVKVDSLDEVYLNNLINSFINISKSNNLVANNYSITFDNNGIIKLVKGGNFNE